MSRPNVFGNCGHSELIVNSSSVNVVINESSFSSTNARSFLVNASSISMEIFNTSFGDNKCEGNGGVLFLKGIDFCKVNVSNSSFANTSSSQAGAFNVECMEVRFNLLASIFLRNEAANGNGGAVLISGHKVAVRFLNSSFTNSLANGSEVYGLGGALFVTSVAQPIHSSIFQANYLDNTLLLTVERCRFIGCSSENGGSLYVEHSKHLQLVIKHSDFIFNCAYYQGAALRTDYTATGFMTDDWRPRKTCIVETLIENSTFSRNEARVGSVLIMYGSNFHMTCSNLTFNKVIMDSNTAMDGSTAVIFNVWKLKISQSRFLSNRAAGEAVGKEIRGAVKSTEVVDSIFDGNYFGKETYSRSSEGGGALTLINYCFHCYYDRAFVFIINSTFNNCSA